MAHSDDSLFPPETGAPAPAASDAGFADDEDKQVLENLRLQHLMRQAQAIVGAQKLLAPGNEAER